MDNSKPPLFKTWGQLYAFVLVVHAATILLLYWITQAYA